MIKYSKIPWRNGRRQNVKILKAPRVGALFASVGRLFHSLTPRYEKHFYPITEDIFGILGSVDVLRRVRASPAEFLVKRWHKCSG